MDPNLYLITSHPRHPNSMGLLNKIYRLLREQYKNGYDTQMTLLILWTATVRDGSPAPAIKLETTNIKSSSKRYIRRAKLLDNTSHLRLKLLKLKMEITFNIITVIYYWQGSRGRNKDFQHVRS